MRKRYRMFLRGSIFWCQDNEIGKQETLRAKDRVTAELLNAQNEAHQQPAINLQIARAYLLVGYPQVATRHLAVCKGRDREAQTRQDTRSLTCGSKIRRWTVCATCPCWRRGRALEQGKVSTNVFLRRIHNLALAMMRHCISRNASFVNTGRMVQQYTVKV